MKASGHAYGEPAVHRGAERPERHFAGAIGVDAQESGAAQVEMVARPGSAGHNPPFANEGSQALFQQPVKAVFDRSNPSYSPGSWARVGERSVSYITELE